VIRAIGRWWVAPVPRGRVAALRTILYLFIFVDVFVTTRWVALHGAVPGELYRPLFLGEVLPLPTPGPVLVPVLQTLLLLCAAIAATGRLPRAAGAAVALLYAQWMFIAFSYGKVDHDRVAFLVALAVLPTAGAARWGEQEADEAAGWAVRTIQVAAVATYFLSVFAKFRFGGLRWLNSASMMRAVVRRGTWFGDLMRPYPLVLQMTQYMIVVFELLSPLLLVGGRVTVVMLIACVVFHAVTFAAVKIFFLPHVMCLLAFLPLERIDPGALLERFRSGRLRPVGRRKEA
jgi:hypothetical protein